MRPIFAVAFMWLLTTGSSCQTTTGSNGMIVQSQNGATIAMVLVFAAYCLLDQEACGGGEPSLEQQLDAKFEENVRLFKSGDSAGLQGICVSSLWLSEGAVLLRRTSFQIQPA